jgi:hypothetical protein
MQEKLRMQGFASSYIHEAHIGPMVYQVAAGTNNVQVLEGQGIELRSQSQLQLEETYKNCP